MNVTSNLEHIHSTISNLEHRYDRAPGSVLLLAVSKGHPLSAIQEAMNAGQRHFGESYYQEALTKITALKENAPCWHFIGPIQSNKTKGIATHFSWVHSIARLSIAALLNDARKDSINPLNICIQINIDHEPTKFGILPSDALDFARSLLTYPNLKLRGLMAIPNPQTSPSQRHEAFSRLAHLQQKIAQTLHYPLDTLSMGMSDDIEEAISAGSTLVRVGRALFGERL